MSLEIHPDPQEPAGGYAFLELPQGSLPEEGARVAVFDAYGERWLAAGDRAGARIGIGDAHWQSERFDFGPYKTYRHEGADWLRIGPEIVNKIEEYMPLRIYVGETCYDVTWPDDVPPRAGAAVLGGIRPVARAQAAEPQPQPLPRTPPAAPEDDAEDIADTVVPPPPPPEAAPDPEPELPPRRLGALMLVLIAVLLALLAAAWWFWPMVWTSEPGPAAAEAGAAPDETPVAEVPADGCSAEALAAVGDGFAEVGAALRGCAGRVTPDAALALVEEYARREDGDALLLFGKLYDKAALDDPIENGIGLTFAADDARAAEYYARAEAAGSAPARQRLATVCARLKTESSTLSRGAYDDYCR